MRLLTNWVESFIDLTNHLPSPEVFRRWSAISAVAGVLERKVWIRSMNMDLYPNLYAVLVGPPGVGKTVATSIVEEMWRDITNLHVAPKSLSKASLIDSLHEAKRTKTIIETSTYMEFHSLLVNAGELGVLIPTYDMDFMNVLTDIYDGRMYEERRRGNNLHIKIKNPQLNILAACTPSYLNSTLPEGAWDQGFLSRTFLIFSGDTNLVDIFGVEDTDQNRYMQLKSDLRSINDMTGAFTFDPAAREAIREWHLAGGPPKPDHPKLIHYNTRRSAHLLKLCMVSSASRGSGKVISLDVYQEALGWLLEAEMYMPEIFKALGARGDGQVIEEAYHFLYSLYVAKKQPIHEERLINFLAERVPSYNVLRIIDLMEKSGKMEKSINDMGQLGWKPKARQAY